MRYIKIIFQKDMLRFAPGKDQGYLVHGRLDFLPWMVARHDEKECSLVLRVNDFQEFRQDGIRRDISTFVFQKDGEYYRAVLHANEVKSVELIFS